MNLDHLPADVSTAITRYETDVKDGALTFTTSEFADEPADTRGGWIGTLVVNHVSAMDVR